MESKKYWIVAQFEFKEIVRKPSFWLATLFLPLLIGVISFITGYANVEASKEFEKGNTQFENVYILDRAGVVDEQLLVEPYEKVESEEEVIESVRSESGKLLIVIPEDFESTYKYELIYKKDEKVLAGITMPMVINGLLKQSALTQIQDPLKIRLLTSDPSAIVKSFDDEGNLNEENFGQYIVPIASLVVFFLAVFISSSFLLQSVSAEKENRMIETMLSIIDKKSLMFGKMIGLMGVVLVQLLLWLALGLGTYVLVQNQFNLNLPIDIGSIDTSMVPINIFLILSAFVFFAAIMTGVGAIGTGAQDSKNLSSIFILLAIFPMYLMQILITNPSGSLSQFFTYFPFTSHMILLLRNSLGAISTPELILGLVITTVYGVISLWIALKLFELGCLMYNRRPSFREILQYFKIGA
ncbi:MAG: ABC transporter permease [Candidatus Dojkabacteria bacterium]|jgi:ABC-2 type transport system permease protein|nr:ABC transporter permease [Candidatus Dojkabacteria bacterium]